MVNIFLCDNSLKSFIENSKMSEEDKKFFIARLPEMNTQERADFFNVLVGLYQLELEENNVLERIKRFW